MPEQSFTPPVRGTGGEALLYEDPDGAIRMEVRLERDTVWLTQKQIAILFQTERSVITKHLRNIFASGELEKKQVCAIFAHTAPDGKTYKTQYYNLDAILAVGYRVNSRRGTQFRIWATQVLRQHLIQGYTVNKRRLTELGRTIQIVSRLAERGEAGADALLRLLRAYAQSLLLLDDYDHRRLTGVQGRTATPLSLSYDEARTVVQKLRQIFQAGELFGQELEKGRLAGILNAVFQTAFGEEVYPTLEEKAAHLLYFIVKGHPFADGNKRIDAALFLHFLNKNGRLMSADGELHFSQEALVTLTLLLAQSPPEEKDLLIALVVALLNGAARTPASG